MNKKTLSKILAIMLVITLTLANFVLVLVYAEESYAASVNYEAQETNINKTNISFDAYFVSDAGVKSHTQVTEMNNNELKLFLDISVTKGYLKEALVSLENANFKLIRRDILPDGVEAIDIEKGTITLKQINKGESKTIILPVEVVKDEQFALNNFSKDTTVRLDGVFVNNSAKEINFNKEIVVNLALSENAESYLNAEVSKYVTFEEKGEKKELLQLTVNSNVINNLLPIKSTEVNIEVPTLHGLNPEYVSVVSASTKATNGNDGTAFGVNNYIYENGIITIKVSNEPNEENRVAWIKNCTDEYIVNLVYNVDDIEEVEEAINKENAIEEVEKVILNLSSKLELYNNEEKIIEKENNQEIELPESKSNIVSVKINNEMKEISKGYMLVKDAANTEYQQKIEVNIGYNPIVNNIEICKGSEYYLDENENKYTATTYYNKIEIKRENLINVLGEQGKIEILNEGIQIATLDAENTVYLFEEEIEKINMITSEPIAEGILVINTDKYIKSAEYDVETTRKLNKITTTVIGKTGLGEETNIAEANLVEPTLQVNTSISNHKLSTVVENENVEIRVALQTNNNTNRLFKNPVIEIELPSYIKEVQVKNVNLLYNTELIATKGNISTNEVGNKVITVKLEGEQTKFSDVLSVEGMTLIIGTDLIVDKTTPSITQKMNVKVINDELEVVESSANIEYVAPTGIITLNSISGFNSKNETVTSMSGNREVGKLEIQAEAKTATQTMTIINNYDYTCGNIAILGRTPAAGNKEISTEVDLGSTFTAKIVSGIKPLEGVRVEDVTVYYSANANATENITDEANGWTTKLEELQEIQSYLIILESTMVKGDKVSFGYDFEIPAKLPREQSIFTMYKVYYTNMDGALQGAKEVAKSSVVGASTGEGAQLELELVANVENGAAVKERQIIEYTLKVKNIGRTAVNNVEVAIDIPEYAYYVEKKIDVETEYYETNPEIKTYVDILASIEPGITKEVKFAMDAGTIIEYDINDIVIRENYETEEEYQAALNDEEILNLLVEEASCNITVQAKATVVEEAEEIVFTSNEITNPKEKAYFSLDWTAENTTNARGTHKTYCINIDKISNVDITNVKIICPIPDGLEYVDTMFSEGINTIREEINENSIIWTIDKLEYEDRIEVTFLIENVEEEKEVFMQMTGTCDQMEGEIKTAIDRFTIGVPRVELVHTSTNTAGTLVEGDDIVYILTVKNISNVRANNVKITDYVSAGLVLQNIKYTSEGTIVDLEASGQVATITTNIPANETLTIEVTAKANMLAEEESAREVTNRFEVLSEDIEKISSSEIKHTVNKRIYSVDNSTTVTTYSISGLAWVDANKNGIRDLEEQTVPEVPVILLNETGNTISSTITGANGSYVFTGIKEGNYIVAFLYDMANYDVTAYRAGETTNDNDVVNMNVNMDGIDTKCGATNVISVLGENVNNIDLGLTVSPKFDLSLTKTISKITVQTAKKTTTNTYNNSTLQKVELSSGELNGATVVVEYAITVRNDGAIAGYAKRIVDYLSTTDLKFNSETNLDWYLGTDGNLYNSTLGDTLLQPGESVALKLVLTKRMTENNTGLTNNTAEIYEAFNDEGIEDFNSAPANKASNENDLGQADIIIGPKTGVVLYIGIILIFMIILTLGVYMVNKKVIKKV